MPAPSAAHSFGRCSISPDSRSAGPKGALLAWGLVAVVLAVIGLGVAHSLSPSIVVVPGTESSRAQQLANAHFGPTQLVPILLQAPAADVARLERQGPGLVRALAKRPHTRVLSAWDAGVAAEGCVRRGPPR